MSTVRTLAVARWKARLAMVVASAGVLAGICLTTAPDAHATETIHLYKNWFKSAETCKAQATKVMKANKDYIGYRCFRLMENQKWSMDVYRDDGLGCAIPADATAPEAVEGVAVQSGAGVVPLCG